MNLNVKPNLEVEKAPRWNLSFILTVIDFSFKLLSHNILLSTYSKQVNCAKLVHVLRDLEWRRMGIAENSSVLTYLSFVVKKLKNSPCENLSANRMPYLLFTLSQSKADM